MNRKKTQLLAGALVGIPLFAFAFLGSGGGPLFTKVASAGYGQDKVEVCHKGRKTLIIGAPAANAHFGHGDTAGACAAAE